MAKKEFYFHGKTLEELQDMGLNEFARLVPARIRRSIKRGIPENHKLVLEKLKKGKPVETHCREMVILPEMVNKTVKVYNGKEFVSVIIQPEMLGHVLGEFSLTRRRVAHSNPGVGATKSSSSVSVR